MPRLQVCCVITKNFNLVGAVPMVTMAQSWCRKTGATLTFTWFARIHTSYINIVTTTWCEAPAQLSHNLKSNFDFEGTCVWTVSVLFKDEAMAKSILATSNPVEQKRFGRKVRNFDKDRWAQRAVEVVREASRAKVSNIVSE